MFEVAPGLVENVFYRRLKHVSSIAAPHGNRDQWLDGDGTIFGEKLFRTGIVALVRFRSAAVGVATKSCKAEILVGQRP